MSIAARIAAENGRGRNRPSNRPVAKALGIAAAGATAYAAWSWRRYRQPIQVPENTVAPPHAWTGADNIPLVGQVNRLKWIITNPIGLVWRSRRHGDVINLRIPTFGDLTYLLFDDAYRMVMSLPADHAAIGRILGNVPTVGFWFPRKESDHDSLQELVLTGRRMMAELLPAIEVAKIPADVPGIVTALTTDWPAEIDLARVIPQIVSDVSGRHFFGTQEWDRIGATVSPLFREIATGIDIPRAMLATLPFQYGMREYRATRTLHRYLKSRNVLQDTTSPTGASIAAANLPAQDALWMHMYITWNALSYPSSYTFWTLLDILERPELLQQIRALPTPDERRELLGNCLLETVRMYPVSSLLRHLKQPLEFTHDGKRYHLPADTLIGVFPAKINRDSDRVPGEPDTYDPHRYSRSPGPRTASFGRGAFGCIAQDFSKMITAAVLDDLLTRFDFDLTADRELVRLCRVHLTYPAEPVYAKAVPR